MFYFFTIIMNIHLFKAALWFIGLIGILVIWTVMAEADIQYYDSNIRYTLNSWFATSQVFTAWTIKISDCDGTNQDTCTTITILDRNLWATSNDIESEDSYWYHFQWWNNYWFKPCTSENCKDFPNEESMWTTQVQPGNISIPYTSPIFYIDPIWNKTNWINDASKIDMRWWTTNSTTDLFDSMGDQINFENIESISEYTSSDDRKVTNAVQRQWPCPDWFHVPSLWEYIKVLDIYQKEKKEGEINLKEIIKEYKIPKGIIDIEEEEEEEEKNKEKIEISEEESKEDKIGFDNDIQPMPSLNQEMKIIIYLSKPKIVVFDGKLGLFYISPPPVNKESEYYFIVKNPENMKIIFKIKLLEIVTCFKKNENSLLFQNFSNKVLVKINHEMNFKNKEECSLIHQGITYLMNNKDDDILY